MTVGQRERHHAAPISFVSLPFPLSPLPGALLGYTPRQEDIPLLGIVHDQFLVLRELAQRWPDIPQTRWRETDHPNRIATDSLPPSDLHFRSRRENMVLLPFSPSMLEGMDDRK